ncbi:DUF302 domain-containing protein [Rubellimicrobium roseum]|uniref:DUF302 domain-containing protein n=1 Tax=Rubellimicrobium roseum TaxID=687525 RepID=A0A5C4NCZ5_9RHOB|nr:DUF302 domain-containing protein [Rubellimicrobium roseum]TNC67219.1 DUF302 domain-containing protein [Rubellimicrobium roseum]
MDYTINRVFPNADVEKVDARVKSALAEQGFGVLIEIDVAATMKTKINQDIAPYRILGACNPTMAFQALGAEPRDGAMQPCNVILRAVEAGVEVSAIDPVASMMAIKNEDLKSAAGEVRDKVRQALEAA